MDKKFWIIYDRLRKKYPKRSRKQIAAQARYALRSRKSAVDSSTDK